MVGCRGRRRGRRVKRSDISYLSENGSARLNIYSTDQYRSVPNQYRSVPNQHRSVPISTQSVPNQYRSEPQSVPITAQRGEISCILYQIRTDSVPIQYCATYSEPILNLFRTVPRIQNRFGTDSELIRSQRVQHVCGDA